ncbi:alpha/beta hydrolase [Bacterioplanoides sp.]|uniref:alpha/beta hydrolase n=1 Tax=Bacterioplanoides sp. TaxID=2066072 RepID=UPI003B008D04
MQRQDIEFVSQGSRCRGWLYRPDGANAAPVIVMAHGLGATRNMGLSDYAEHFCRAGYACLVFDYRYFGDSDGQPRQLLDIHKQRQDWQAAIQYVRGLEIVDGQRVILWGSSFSGGHVLAVAAQDQNIAAVISQCPFTDGLASVLAMPPLTALRVSAKAVLDQLGSLVGAKPVMVALAGKPGSVALMTAEDCEPGYFALIPEADRPQFRNEVAARIALHISWNAPGRQVKRIQAPILFCICDQDSVAPAAATRRYAQQAPQADIKHYPLGHFDIYKGTAFQQVIQDQLDFLQRQVPVQ